MCRRDTRSLPGRSDVPSGTPASVSTTSAGHAGRHRARCRLDPSTPSANARDEIERWPSLALAASRLDADRPLDHGVWVPLRRMYPASDIPVVALSVNPSKSAEWHYRLGRALAPLRDEGVLVVGSGGFSHNLRALDWQHAQAAAYPWVTAFTDPLRAALLEGDVATALDWTSLPHAAQNHPTTEHLYPLYVALGAGGEGVRGHLLRRDVEMGGLALDAFAFDTA